MVEVVKDASGILLVDKPEGITSFRVISIVRNACGIKKVGHIGTLDPFATGLLPVCIGKATRTVTYMEHFDKTYECVVRFGAFSDTQDCMGQFYGGEEASPEEIKKYSLNDYKEMKKLVKNLVGEQQQTPPQYSAIKIKGRPAYSYARKGQAVHIEPRTIKVYSAEVIDISYDHHFEMRFEISCSKGTYIRTICEQLGHITGWGAYAKQLRRTQCGHFSIQNAYDLDQIQNELGMYHKKLLLPITEGVRHLPILKLSRKESDRIKQGQKMDLSVFESRIQTHSTMKYRAMYNDQLIAIVYPCYNSNPAVLRIERMMA